MKDSQAPKQTENAIRICLSIDPNQFLKEKKFTQKWEGGTTLKGPKVHKD